LHFFTDSASKITNFKAIRTSEKSASTVDALSYVLIAGYGDTSKQGVMKLRPFFIHGKKDNIHQ